MWLLSFAVKHNCWQRVGILSTPPNAMSALHCDYRQFLVPCCSKSFVMISNLMACLGAVLTSARIEEHRDTTLIPHMPDLSLMICKPEVQELPLATCSFTATSRRGGSQRFGREGVFPHTRGANWVQELTPPVAVAAGGRGV